METTKKSEIVYNAPTIRSWKDEGHFIIPKVFYKGKTGTYRLFEKMTPEMNQEQLAALYEKEKQKGNPYPTDAPLIWAICTSAYILKNENPETSKKLKNLLENNFKRYPNTLTKIIYNPSGKDKIIHNYKTSDQYSLDGKVVGPDNWINKISDKNILEKLLGTSNIEQINEVSQWINRTNSYLWRLKSNSKTKDERVARFYAYDDGLDLLCDGYHLDEYPAFRVLKVD